MITHGQYIENGGPMITVTRENAADGSPASREDLIHVGRCAASDWAPRASAGLTLNLKGGVPQNRSFMRPSPTSLSRTLNVLRRRLTKPPRVAHVIVAASGPLRRSVSRTSGSCLDTSDHGLTGIEPNHRRAPDWARRDRALRSPEGRARRASRPDPWGGMGATA